MALKGIKPTSSLPVIRTPLLSALFSTSSKNTWIGVILKLVRLAEICAIPYSSMYHPTALTALQVPGIRTGSPFASFTTSPVYGLPFLSTLPASLTSNAIRLAIRVDLVFRFMLYAIRKSRAPITVAPAVGFIS